MLACYPNTREAPLQTGEIRMHNCKLLIGLIDKTEEVFVKKLIYLN